MFDSRIVYVALGGALLALDRRALLQGMLSHPVVAAPLVGWALGDLPTGLAVGVLIGLLWSGALPVGGVVPPDETLAAVVGTAAAVLGARAAGLSIGTASMLGFAAAMIGALVGRRLELVLRRINGELAIRAEKNVAKGDVRAIDRTIFAALGITVLATFLVQLSLLAAFVPAARAVAALSTVVPHLETASLPVPMAGLGGVIVLAGFRVGLAWATLGFAVGLAVAEVIG